MAYSTLSDEAPLISGVPPQFSPFSLPISHSFGCFQSIPGKSLSVWCFPCWNASFLVACVLTHSLPPGLLVTVSVRPPLVTLYQTARHFHPMHFFAPPFLFYFILFYFFGYSYTIWRSMHSFLVHCLYLPTRT